MRSYNIRKETCKRIRVALVLVLLLLFNPHPRTCLLIVERWREKQRERNISVREKH